MHDMLAASLLVMLAIFFIRLVRSRPSPQAPSWRLLAFILYLFISHHAWIPRLPPSRAAQRQEPGLA